MKAKYLFGAVLISFASCASSTAPKQLSVQAVDMQSELCTVTSATNDELSVHAIGFVRLLDRATEINKNFEKLMNSRKWKDGVAVGEQMNSAEAVEFGKLQVQTSSSLWSIIFESKRERDIKVFARMAKISAQISADSYTLPTDTNSEEYILAQFVMGGQKIFPISDDTYYESLSQRGNCNLEHALLSSAERALDNKDLLKRFESFKKSAENFAIKYGKPIVVDRMTSEDRGVFEAGKTSVAEMERMIAHSKNLVLISKLEAVSKLQLEVRRKSQYEAPENIDHISVVWDEWRKNGKITDEQNELTRFTNYINEKIPSEFTKEAAKEN
jgi:hypothetical protein